jgi:hypothetical protein
MYAHCNSHHHANCDSDLYAHSDSCLYADRDSYGHSDNNSYGHVYTDGDSYGYGNPYAYRNANALCFNCRLLGEPCVVPSNHTARVPDIHSGPRDLYHSELHQRRQDLFTRRTVDRREA